MLSTAALRPATVTMPPQAAPELASTALRPVASTAEVSDLSSFLRLKFGSLKNAFRALDSNAAGYLTLDTFADGIRRVGYEKDAHGIFYALDVQHSGIISVRAFLLGAGGHGDAGDAASWALSSRSCCFSLESVPENSREISGSTLDEKVDKLAGRVDDERLQREWECTGVRTSIDAILSRLDELQGKFGAVVRQAEAQVEQTTLRAADSAMEAMRTQLDQGLARIEALAAKAQGAAAPVSLSQRSCTSDVEADALLACLESRINNLISERLLGFYETTERRIERQFRESLGSEWQAALEEGRRGVVTQAVEEARSAACAESQRCYQTVLSAQATGLREGRNEDRAELQVALVEGKRSVAQAIEDCRSLVSSEVQRLHDQALRAQTDVLRDSQIAERAEWQLAFEEGQRNVVTLALEEARTAASCESQRWHDDALRLQTDMLRRSRAEESAEIKAALETAHSNIVASALEEARVVASGESQRWHDEIVRAQNPSALDGRCEKSADVQAAEQAERSSVVALALEEARIVASSEAQRWHDEFLRAHSTMMRESRVLDREEMQAALHAAQCSVSQAVENCRTAAKVDWQRWQDEVVCAQAVMVSESRAAERAKLQEAIEEGRRSIAQAVEDCRNAAGAEAQRLHTEVVRAKAEVDRSPPAPTIAACDAPTIEAVDILREAVQALRVEHQTLEGTLTNMNKRLDRDLDLNGEYKMVGVDLLAQAIDERKEAERLSGSMLSITEGRLGKLERSLQEKISGVSEALGRSSEDVAELRKGLDKVNSDIAGERTDGKFAHRLDIRAQAMDERKEAERVGVSVLIATEKRLSEFERSLQAKLSGIGEVLGRSTEDVLSLRKGLDRVSSEISHERQERETQLQLFSRDFETKARSQAPPSVTDFLTHRPAKVDDSSNKSSNLTSSTRCLGTPSLPDEKLNSSHPSAPDSVIDAVDCGSSPTASPATHTTLPETGSATGMSAATSVTGSMSGFAYSPLGTPSTDTDGAAATVAALEERKKLTTPADDVPTILSEEELGQVDVESGVEMRQALRQLREENMRLRESHVAFREQSLVFQERAMRPVEEVTPPYNNDNQTHRPKSPLPNGGVRFGSTTPIQPSVSRRTSCPGSGCAPVGGDGPLLKNFSQPTFPPGQSAAVSQELRGSQEAAGYSEKAVAPPGAETVYLGDSASGSGCAPIRMVGPGIQRTRCNSPLRQWSGTPVPGTSVVRKPSRDKSPQRQPPQISNHVARLLSTKSVPNLSQPIAGHSKQAAPYDSTPSNRVMNMVMVAPDAGKRVPSPDAGAVKRMISGWNVPLHLQPQSLPPQSPLMATRPGVLVQRKTSKGGLDSHLPSSAKAPVALRSPGLDTHLPSSANTPPSSWFPQ